MSAAAARRPSCAKLHPPATGTCRLYSAPVASCKANPEGKPGSVAINGTVYAIRYICHLDSEGVYQVAGYTLVNIEKDERYEVEADFGLQNCSCPDATYRTRIGGCKHVAALRSLNNHGLIA